MCLSALKSHGVERMRLLSSWHSYRTALIPMGDAGVDLDATDASRHSANVKLQPNRSRVSWLGDRDVNLRHRPERGKRLLELLLIAYDHDHDSVRP